MIPAAVPIALAGAQALFGGIQAGIGASKLKNLNRPTYTVPEEIKKNLSESELMALEGLPAEQKQQYIQNIQRSQQTAMKGLETRKAGLAGIPALLQSQNDAFTNLLTMDATQKLQNKMLVQQNRNTLAGYKDKEFDINKMQPYQEKSAEAQALIGSGVQNIFGGLDQAATFAAMGGENYKNNEFDPTADPLLKGVPKRIKLNPTN